MSSNNPNLGVFRKKIFKPGQDARPDLGPRRDFLKTKMCPFYMKVT